MQQSPTITTDPSEWRARIALGFRRAAGRTVLARRARHGPLQVQRPFYPQGGQCHVYLLHPPGGIVGGDRLEVDIDCGAGSEVLITTPAAGKFYRSAGAHAYLEQRLRVRRDALLEWLPQETIVFDGARAHSRTRIEIDADAGVLAWEILCLGRPASDERFDHGDFNQHMELYRQGRPLLLERNAFVGGSAVLRAPWGLGGHPVSALLFAAGIDMPDPAALRAELAEWAPDEAALTVIDGVLVVRWLGDCTERARHCLAQVRQWLRPDAARPRIWDT